MFGNDLVKNSSGTLLDIVNGFGGVKPFSKAMAEATTSCFDEAISYITKLVKNYYSKFTNSFSYSLLIFCLGLSIIVVILLFL